MAEKTVATLLRMSLKTESEVLESAEKANVDFFDIIVAEEAVENNVATAAEETSVAVNTFIKYTRVISKTLGVVGILRTIETLIYDGIEGKKQKEKLQG